MYTNNSDIPLPFAVWLAADHGYDLRFDPTVVSATEILRPIRSIILSRQLAAEEEALEESTGVPTRDIAEKAASSLGTAVHTAVELAWTQHYKLALQNLDFPQSMIDKIRINPGLGHTEDHPETVNMYFERRASKQLEGFTISGKFDLVMMGQIHDIKTTKAYTYIKGSNDRKYVQQGSIYRWLNPDIVTSDRMFVDYYFTDWNPVNAVKQAKDNYPPNRMLAKAFTLMPVEETEEFIRGRLQEIKRLTGKSQDVLPLCTPEELWQNPAKWEYWSKDTNKQCSKLLDSREEAQAYLNEKGIGFIQERQFEPTFCLYCDAKSICNQAKGFIASGLLTT